MRQALESSHTTSNLHSWIDLIFGYKQTGRHAIESLNCYHPAVYFGYPVELIKDQIHRKAIETMIKTWGQTPKQLFHSSPHVMASKRFANVMMSASNNGQRLEMFENTNSIHRFVKLSI